MDRGRHAAARHTLRGRAAGARVVAITRTIAQPLVREMSKRLESIDAMIAKGSRDPFVFYARAMELKTLGRHDEALDAFRACERDFPTYVPTYLMAGQLAIELARLDDARGFLERGLVRARESGDAHAASEIEALLPRTRSDA
jgi:tetratricopeptide (TPR) repeat protein